MPEPVEKLYETEVVPVEEVFPNTYNPVIMGEKDFRLLKKNIQSEGFVGAILVRRATKEEKEERGANYIILDGEHRWTAAKELGFEKIPLIVMNRTDDQGKIATISFNKLRGEFDSVKLAELIVDLRKRTSDEELHERLGFNVEALNDFSDLTKDIDDFPEPKGKGLDIPETKEDNWIQFRAQIPREDWPTVHGELSRLIEVNNIKNKDKETAYGLALAKMAVLSRVTPSSEL